VAYQIRRSHLRWNSKPFQYFLDVPGQESCNIGNALFDRHGRLKPHLYGNFGAETDQGMLYNHIESLFLLQCIMGAAADSRQRAVASVRWHGLLDTSLHRTESLN